MVFHLLASAVVGGFELWTTDGNVATLAVELGVAFRAAS